MKQIRNNTFETNSSSTHSICISNECPSELPPSVYFGHGEFEWGFDTLRDSYERAAYLNEALHYMEEDEDKYRRELVKKLKSHNIKVYFEEDKYEYGTWGGAEKYYVSGHIDHGNDTREFVEAMIAPDDDRLFTYLFGDAFVFIGNDNCDLEEGGDFGPYTFTNYQYELKDEYKDWSIFEKGN